MEPRNGNTVPTRSRPIPSSLPVATAGLVCAKVGTNPSSPSLKENTGRPDTARTRGIMQSRIPVKSLMANFENMQPAVATTPSPSASSFTGLADAGPQTRPSARRYDPRTAQTLTCNRKVNAIIKPAGGLSAKESPRLRRTHQQSVLAASPSPTRPEFSRHDEGRDIDREGGGGGGGDSAGDGSSIQTGSDDNMCRSMDSQPGSFPKPAPAEHTSLNRDDKTGTVPKQHPDQPANQPADHSAGQPDQLDQPGRPGQPDCERTEPTGEKDTLSAPVGLSDPSDPLDHAAAIPDFITSAHRTPTITGDGPVGPGRGRGQEIDQSGGRTAAEPDERADPEAGSSISHPSSGSAHRFYSDTPDQPQPHPHRNIQIIPQLETGTVSTEAVFASPLSAATVTAPALLGVDGDAEDEEWGSCASSTIYPHDSASVGGGDRDPSPSSAQVEEDPAAPTLHQLAVSSHDFLAEILVPHRSGRRPAREPDMTQVATVPLAVAEAGPVNGSPALAAQAPVIKDGAGLASLPVRKAVEETDHIGASAAQSRSNGSIFPTSPIRMVKKKESQRLAGAGDRADKVSRSTAPASAAPIPVVTKPAVPVAKNPIPTSNALPTISEPPAAPAIKTERVKKLVERRHILKEFVETEKSLHNDMMIVNNIYKGTSDGVLSDIDRRTLFGNIDQVCALTGRLADQFRTAADPEYAAKRESRRIGDGGPIPDSQHQYPDRPFTDWPEAELLHFDVRTELGAVFIASMADIYEVYGYYLKNHSWANAKLTDLERDPSVAVWLEECRASATDLTSAWNLNALLVKPMQRVTKYPLMLRSLIKATEQDHPDKARLDRAIDELEDRLRVWNEAQDAAATRKESDLLPKLALGNRRAEKMKQQVGITNSVEDPEYDKLSQRFGGHFFQLQIVIRDVNTHIETVQANMARHSAFVAAADAFCRFDDRPVHPEAQSGLITYSRIVTDMSTVGLPRHVGGIRQHVLDPLEQLWRLHQGPQELMKRRKKRSVDYVRWRLLVGRGESPDRRLREAADLFKTTNDRLKDELPKLYDLSRRLVKVCLDNLISLQSSWHDNWVRKLDLAAREPARTDDLTADLRRVGDEYVAEFSYVQSRLRDLAVCNGNIRTLADPSGFLRSSESSSFDGSVSRGRAGTVGSSHRAGSTKSDVDPHRLSATTLGSAFGRSTVDASSASARSSRGPVTPQSGSQTVRPGLTKAPSFGSARSGRFGRLPFTSSAAGPGMVRSSSGNGAGPPRLSLDIADDFGRVPMSADAGGPAGMVMVPDAAAIGVAGFGAGAGGSGVGLEPGRSTHHPFSSVMPVDSDDGLGDDASAGSANDVSGYKVLFVAASLYEFQVEDTRSFVGFPYLQYTTGEIFDVIGQNGELWMARNQDDPDRRVGWIWERHFARILPDDDE